MATDPKQPIFLDLKLTRFAPQLNVKEEGNNRLVFGMIRKKWYVLQPEEFVRQLLLHFLIGDMKYNRNRITVERGITINDGARRTDILVFDRDMRPFLLIECKAPGVKLSTDTFRQAANYNGALQVPYLMISNGRKNVIAEIDYAAKDYAFLDRVPEWI
ncbi:type I restriction enzyme HsdR N-terminal domain-containing protein [Lewinella sp. 4G2]|uniref:type I restriction enzyme HsdR N-terminal domain-containing protein n=1 Tax=Lewinella sp. 4G2 TaxID=1803372 RepID=UPI0007B46E8F|nr:type I restriction enzyme HsdR N-terminal domain-containing protein [Lewinella sp. 4G2]OAV45348.1 restriction endonuclease subunit R [Lewinella sp. 4G2]